MLLEIEDNYADEIVAAELKETYRSMAKNLFFLELNIRSFSVFATSANKDKKRIRKFMKSMRPVLEFYLTQDDYHEFLEEIREVYETN